jgi:hypothetical protein
LIEAAMPRVMEPRGTYFPALGRASLPPRWKFEPDVRFETADLQSHMRLVEFRQRRRTISWSDRTGHQWRAWCYWWSIRAAHDFHHVMREASSTRLAIVAVREVLDRAASRGGSV